MAANDIPPLEQANRIRILFTVKIVVEFHTPRALPSPLSFMTSDLHLHMADIRRRVRTTRPH